MKQIGTYSYLLLDTPQHKTIYIYAILKVKYRGADKFLARPGTKQPRKHIRDARDFNNIGTRAVIQVFFPARQGAE